MEHQSFTITVNNTEYSVKLHCLNPKLYDVTHKTAYHRIGKTDAGAWVYVETPAAEQHMPLQEIGNAIDEYTGDVRPGQDN